MCEFLQLDIKIHLGLWSDKNNKPTISTLPLIQALKVQLPQSVQILNVISILQKGLYSKENIQCVKFWSYEDVETPFQNWEDLNRPLMLFCEMATNYPVDPWTYRILYCRGDPHPQAFFHFSKLFDWSTPFGIGAVSSNLIPYLQQQAALHWGDFHPVAEWAMYLPQCKFHTFNKEDNIFEDADSSFHLSSVPLSHARTINSHWHLKDGSTLAQIQDAITHSISAGLFTHPDNGLVSWIISLPFGTLNALHTLEHHRRKGYAELVLRFACKQLIEQGLHPFCEVEQTTPSSRELLEKVGFKVVDDVFWMPYKPNSHT